MRSCTTGKGVPTLLGINKTPDSAFWNVIVSKPAINLCELHKKSDFKAQEMIQAGAGDFFSNYLLV